MGSIETNLRAAGSVRRAVTMRRQRGLTLIEMLVAMALTLMLLMIVSTIFGNVGGSVAFSRAGLEMSDRLRLARNILQDDLSQCTCPPMPWRRPEENVGYFEYFEGTHRDRAPTSLASTDLVLAPPTGLGDYDDVLMMTVHSPEVPFTGIGPTGVVESHYAEVVWWAVENPAGGANGEPGMRTIYRRVLLIAPWVDVSLQSPNSFTYYNLYDISSRPTTTGRIANTLGDLTKRENRFGHTLIPTDPDLGFPHQLDLVPASSPIQPLTGDRQGMDIIIANALAFDVRAYDPGAPIYDSSGTAVSQGDDGWLLINNTVATPIGYGSYVDLGYAPPNAGTAIAIPSFFNALQRQHLLAGNAFCTWSWHYEVDGIDQTDPPNGADEGADNQDNNGNGLIDEAAERETSPPYLSPVRGIEVRLRAYEPDSRQMRQVTVLQNFVPM